MEFTHDNSKESVKRNAKYWSTGTRKGWESGQDSKESRGKWSPPGYFLKYLVSDV